MIERSEKSKKVRIAAVGDLHVKEHYRGTYQKLFSEISDTSDVLVLCGDLTDLGLPSEAKLLSDDLRSCRVPIVGVLGNHDYHSDQEQEVRKILEENNNVYILQEEAQVIAGVGFAGVKGFIGGFETFSLGPHGEKEIKMVIKERDNQAYGLENQLRQINQIEKRVVVLHYSPIKETVANEPQEIMPFLGSTRYEQTIDQYGAVVVFHGHANAGPHEGKTKSGIPVYNVAMPLLEKVSPEQPYKLYEV